MIARLMTAGAAAIAVFALTACAAGNAGPSASIVETGAPHAGPIKRAANLSPNWKPPKNLEQTDNAEAVAAHAGVRWVPEGGWRALPNPQAIYPGDGAQYFEFNLPNGSKAHLVVVDMRSGKWRIRPFMSETTQPTSLSATQQNASAATNAGYFNLSKGAGTSASYIIEDQKMVADPNTNKGLITNPKIIPFLDQILNRSEIRFEKTAKGEDAIDIQRHNTPAPHGVRIIDSIQAGPQLLPQMDSTDEGFVRHNMDGSTIDSINTLKDAARTAFGITADGHAMMVCIAGKGQDPESSGIALPDLQQLLKQLGCTHAINLDGGSSTTMYVRFAPGSAGETEPSGKVVVGKSPETLVKSILLLEPRRP